MFCFFYYIKHIHFYSVQVKSVDMHSRGLLIPRITEFFVLVSNLTKKNKALEHKLFK